MFADLVHLFVIDFLQNFYDMPEVCSHDGSDVLAAMLSQR